MAEYVLPERAVEYIMYVTLRSQADPDILITNPTIAAGDFKTSKDGAASGNLTTLPVVTPAAGQSVKITLSLTEMTGDNVIVVAEDVAGGEWQSESWTIQTATRPLEDYATAAALVTTDGVVDATQAIVSLLPDAGALDDLALILADTANMQPKFVGITLLAEWLGIIAGKQAGDAAALAEMKTTGAGSGTLDPTTDSNEAIRDTAPLGSTMVGTDGANTTTPPTVAAIADGVHDEALAGHVVAGSAGKKLGDIPTTAMRGTDSGALATVLGTPVLADISADIAANLTAINALNNLSAADIGAAIEDAGLVLQTTTIATLASQTSFTLTAGSADDNAYNDCYLIAEDVSTAIQKCVGYILDYTGSTKAITLEADPGIFAMAATDKVRIVPNCSVWRRIMANFTTSGTTGAALDTAGGSAVNQYLVYGAAVQHSDGSIYWVTGVLKNGQPFNATACTIQLVLTDGDGTKTDVSGATETVANDDANNVVNGTLSNVSLLSGRQYYVQVSLTADGGTRKGNLPVTVPVRTS